MHLDPPKPHQKLHRERDAAPIITDFAEKMTALKRKEASQSRTKDRSERPVLPASQGPPSPPEGSPRPLSTEPDPAEFSRVLNLSPSQRPVHAHAHAPSAKHAAKLFNPDTDPIPMRRTAEPEAMSDSAGSSHPPRAPAESSRQRDASQHRQLFDHRKHDPVSFSAAQARKPVPTPKSSGDYASVSSASSYAHSVVSSNFTLSSSTTDGSSAPSSLFDHKQPREESKSAFSTQLKKLYRDISALETKILTNPGEPADDSRIVIKGGSVTGSEEAEKARWKKAIEDHKLLADMMLNLLEISQAPGVPVSLRNIPEKYNIITRLWTNGFHRLLENLRRSSLGSKIAMEYLQEFIYYAYTFYTALLEREPLLGFRSGWLEALGDLARYRMAIAAMIPAPAQPSSTLTVAAINSALRASPVGSNASPMGGSNTNSEKLPGRGDSQSPSVGIVAARLMELEPEKDRWRTIARDWYAEGVSATPGHGKLHHHLGLLSRETEGEELRGVYHFVKSMIAIRPFETARESVLPLWSPAAQARRSAPDARAPELFVVLHGMLFTNIQLDDFSPILARLLERLTIEEPQGSEWAMMAAINIGALLEYGRPQGVLRRTGALGLLDRNPAAIAAATKVKLARKSQADERMDVDGDERRKSSDAEAASPLVPNAIQVSPALSEAASTLELPPAFKMAQELTFAMLAHALKHTGATPNPYITVILTFMQTILRHPEGLATLERAIPWAELAAFYKRAPHVSSKYTQSDKLGSRSVLLEDWAVRGMAWSGRHVFERGFWDGCGGRLMEMEMLDAVDAPGETPADGVWNDDEDDKPTRAQLAWRRTAWAGAKLARFVPGFRWDGKRAWAVDGVLAEKVRAWAAEDRAAHEEAARRRLGTRWVDADGDEVMDVDEDAGEGDDEDVSEDDENDSEEIRALKARRRYLRSLLQASTSPSALSAEPPRTRHCRNPARARAPARPLLQLVPGYTVLVLDTNILLSSLSSVAALVTSLCWTVVVPLPAIMELDGLAAAPAPLGDAARAAVAFVVAHVRSHADALKVQTSRGNYLASLTVRRELVDFDDPQSQERSMDDLILKSARWQDEHWADRSAMLRGAVPASERPPNAARVVLLSLDRNLRLKARARQLDAAGEEELAALLAATT
ncbi:hypothetical protein BC834DRAFT_889594 [Gloeopeniophorella convolvens]|nr:hypothetical protein BC834DRAFT_889594 [Gloeopeniophorella convolvens]